MARRNDVIKQKGPRMIIHRTIGGYTLHCTDPNYFPNDQHASCRWSNGTIVGSGKGPDVVTACREAIDDWKRQKTIWPAERKAMDVFSDVLDTLARRAVDVGYGH